ncbi:MAG: PAS domain-containing sensor histidine kinase [Ignavibacteria bacterium]|nr:PAS domain-containing sensor histidine kinase [Ignavibacteria bacterium]
MFSKLIIDLIVSEIYFLLFVSRKFLFSLLNLLLKILLEKKNFMSESGFSENYNNLNPNFPGFLVEQFDLVFWTVDSNLVITSLFGGGLKNISLRKNELVGLSLYQYLNTNDKNLNPIAKHIEALKGQRLDFTFNWQKNTYHIFLEPLISQDGNINGVAGFAINLTKEKNFLENFIASEKKYQALFEATNDAIFLMKNDIFIDCNPAALVMFECQKEDIIGKTLYKFSPTLQFDGRNSREKALELINDALNGKDLTFEWLHTSLKGKQIFAEVKLSRVLINENLFLVAIVRDITDKKAKDQKIKLLANALESVNECVSITDLNNNIIYVNQTFADVYGYSKEELIGKPIPFVRSEKNEPEITNQIYSETFKGGWKGELWNKRKNGEDFLIRLSTSPVHDENQNIIALIGVASDITKEKELFNKIIYDAERLKILFENAPDPIFIFDFNGIIIDANSASEKLVGWRREEAFGKSFSELKFFDKPNLFKALKILSKSLNGETTGPTEFVITNRSGEKIFVEASTHPIEIEGKKYVLCVARDISERKKILFELAKAKEAAELANRQKTIFFASMSHEIRTPINAIIGFSEVLKDIYYEQANDETKTYFDILQNAAKNLLSTISQILDFTRIEAGLFDYQIKEVDIKKEIQIVTEMLKVSADKKNLKILSNLPEEKIIVKADAYMLNGIITNLLNNAIKYSEKGTVKITLESDDHWAICTIEDEGLGMSEEFQKNLFEHFTREKREIIKRKEGSGLGLALTKKYIELNNGQISIKSKLNVGTTVTFKIPLAL